MIKLHSLGRRIGREGHFRACHGRGVFRGSVRNGQGILFRLVQRCQGHIVRRHIEYNTSVSLFFRSQFQTRCFPAGEDPSGAVLRVCIDILPVFLWFCFSVHGQSIVVDCIVCRQGHIPGGHGECKGLAGFVCHCHAIHRPVGEGVALLFRRRDGNRLTIVLELHRIVYGQRILICGIVGRQGHIAGRHPEEQGLVIWVIDLCTFHGPTGKGVAFLFRRSHIDQ